MGQRLHVRKIVLVTLLFGVGIVMMVVLLIKLLLVPERYLPVMLPGFVGLL